MQNTSNRTSPSKKNISQNKPTPLSLDSNARSDAQKERNHDNIATKKTRAVKVVFVEVEKITIKIFMVIKLLNSFLLFVY